MSLGSVKAGASSGSNNTRHNSQSGTGSVIIKKTKTVDSLNNKLIKTFTIYEKQKEIIDSFNSNPSQFKPQNSPETSINAKKGDISPKGLTHLRIKTVKESPKITRKDLIVMNEKIKEIRI
jgi:hypothetical protein